MKHIVIGIIIMLFPISLSAENILLEKKDYLTLIVGNYVHGFKEFETSVTSFEDSVSIGIYYNISTQSKERANQLAERFRFQVSALLSRYSWAKNIKVIVNVYPENTPEREYRNQ